MIKNKCKHEWRQFTNSKTTNNGDTSAKFECTECKQWLNASEVFQLEILENLTGFQKWLSIIATVISIIALVSQLLK